MKQVLVIAGPTASGKSALALDLAQRWDATVINADAMQVYAELAILTARPLAAELARAPHRLYGIWPVGCAGSVAAWRKLALAEILRAPRPIVVGGTGLYLRALIDGLVEIPAIDPAIRAAGEQRRAEIGEQAFHAEVAALDPDLAALRPAADRQRLVRGWAVATATGRPLSAWQRDPPEPPPAALRFRVLCLAPPRDRLYAAIDRRVTAMVAAGAVAEAAMIGPLAGDLPALKAVGLREFQAVAAGAADLADAVVRVQAATRHYAKRQTTWFRHSLRVDDWWDKQSSFATGPDRFHF